MTSCPIALQFINISGRTMTLGQNSFQRGIVIGIKREFE
jgi:hypothetical protein